MKANEFIALLRDHRLPLVVVPLLVALITGVVSWVFLPNEYTAEVSIYAMAKSTSQSDASGDVTYSDLNASQLLANDFAELAKNDQIREATAQKLGLKSLTDFDIDIKASSTTRIIKVDVTAQDPQAATAVANELTNQIGQTATRVMDVEAVNVINAAQVPDQPSGPPRVRYVVISVPLALLAVVLVLVIRAKVDTRVHGGGDVEDLLGVSVIGHVPTASGR